MTEDQLVEIAAKAIRKSAEFLTPSSFGTVYLNQPVSEPDAHKWARAAVEAVRPHIEAIERERCARIAHRWKMKVPDWADAIVASNIEDEIRAGASCQPNELEIAQQTIRDLRAELSWINTQIANGVDLRPGNKCGVTSS